MFEAEAITALLAEVTVVIEPVIALNGTKATAPKDDEFLTPMATDRSAIAIGPVKETPLETSSAIRTYDEEPMIWKTAIEPRAVETRAKMLL